MSNTVFTISIFALTATFLGVLAFAEPLGKPIVKVFTAWLARLRKKEPRS